MASTPLDTARTLHAFGIYTIPVPYKTRKPSDRGGWEQERHKPEAFTTLYDRDTNIGSLLCEDSGNLMDADMDRSTARRAARWFLPDTGLIWGRSGAADSHRMYRAVNIPQGAVNLSWDDPLADPNVEIEGHKGGLCELRIHGQTIAPGSTYENDDLAEFLQCGAPATLDYAQAKIAMGRIATVALLLPRWAGSRHNMTGPLSGLLCHGGMAQADAEHLLTALCTEAGDTEVANRLTYLRNTYARAANGENITGGPTLETYLDAREISAIRSWLGLRSNTNTPGGESQAARMLELVKAVFEQPGNEVFRDASGEAYATVPINHHHETHTIRSTAFRNWLNVLYYRAHRINPSRETIARQVAGLEARAQYDACEHPAYVRIAQPEPTTMWVDLGTNDHSAVRITPTGWTLEAQPAIAFRRLKGMLPLAVPQQPPEGETLETLLRPFINLDQNDPHAWPLLLSWLCSTFWTAGPFPVLQLHGEQGSAKTTTGRIARALIDPNKRDLSIEPRDAERVILAANNNWLVAYDNISHIQLWLSDLLCNLSTGGGSSDRTKYTNDEETIFEFKRPVLLTGVDEVITRPDLLDRTLSVGLQRPRKHKQETVFWREFAEQRPYLLGALYNTVSQVMAMLPTIGTSALELPRMADFYVLGLAVERVMGWEAGTFEAAYSATRVDAREVALEANPVYAVFVRWLNKNKFPPTNPWVGNMTELLQEIENERQFAYLGGSHVPLPPFGWPRSGRGLTSVLTGIRGHLEATGITLEAMTHGRKYRITDNRTDEQRAEQSPERKLRMTG